MADNQLKTSYPKAFNELTKFKKIKYQSGVLPFSEISMHDFDVYYLRITNYEK